MSPPLSPFAIIGFEASCLPDAGMSFPIEVALAEIGGASREWLIRPLPAWRYWDWAPEAEALHGISRDMLACKGVSAAQVYEELGRATEGRALYADSDLDAYWMETLAVAVGRPPLAVRYVGELFQSLGIGAREVARAEARARERLPREHVANRDARRLAKTIELILRQERLVQVAKAGATVSAALLAGLALGRRQPAPAMPTGV